jgi:hypothetical protein
MIRVLLVAFVIAFAAGAALAGNDDVLIVTGSRVNLREGPSKDTDVVGRLIQGQVIVELEREGEWHRVDIGGGRPGGWVHTSLVRLLPRQEGVTGAGGPAFERFRAALDEDNRRRLQETGTYPFVLAEDLGDGMVAVTPSEDWFVGGGDLTDDAWRLYRLWKSENGGKAVTLAITDEQGNVYITVQDTATEPLITVHH